MHKIKNTKISWNTSLNITVVRKSSLQTKKFSSSRIRAVNNTTTIMTKIIYHAKSTKCLWFNPNKSELKLAKFISHHLRNYRGGRKIDSTKTIYMSSKTKRIIANYKERMINWHTDIKIKMFNTFSSYHNFILSPNCCRLLPHSLILTSKIYKVFR